MNKLFKKILSIIITVIMLVTSVPFALAAGDGVKTTIDITGFEGSRLSLGENYNYYDEDGYILTGTRDELIIYFYHSCDVILNNLSAGVIDFSEAAQEVNFTLEGDNYLSYSSKSPSFYVYCSHITINGGEDDTLTCTSPAGLFNTVGQPGSVTINGGVIKGVTDTTSDFYSIACHGGFTMNGGEVTVSNNYSYTLSDHITLNGGVLNAISTAENGEASSADISIAKGALLTVSTQTELLYSNSELTAVNEETYLFARFDTESEFLPTKNIFDVVFGKTYVEITADEHTHSYKEDGYCICGEECLHETIINGLCELCKTPMFAITHQPTADEPYVETNVNDAAYQWLEITYDEEEIADNTGTAIGVHNSEGTSSFYDEVTGWNGVWFSEDGIAYFYVYLESGQKIKVVPSEFCATLVFYDTYHGYGTYESTVDAGEEVVFTAQSDGKYEVYAFLSPGNHPTLRAYHLNLEYSELDGETSAELKNGENGKYYACEVTYRNGETELSDSFGIPYEITHQPTADEPYVELNDDTNAAYQWYGVEETKTEYTNENATAYSYNDATATYDAENGWTPVEDSFGDYSSATISAEAGDVIMVEVSESGFEDIGIYDFNQRTGGYSEEKDGTLVYSFTVTKTGEYTVYTNNPVNCRAYNHVIKNTPVEGQTSAVFTPTELGHFACEVTFANGSKEMSDTFEVTELPDPSADCEHLCHNDNWFMSFIWSVATFLFRLLNIQQYCDCGELHYDAPFFG